MKQLASLSFVLAGILSFLIAPQASATNAASTGGAISVTPTGTATLKLEDWQSAMAKIPLPQKNKCYTAAYPTLAWKEIACVVPPNVPFRPTPQNVGGVEMDYAATATGGDVKSAQGSFDSVTGVKSVSGPLAGEYSLQLNTNQFSTAMCGGAIDPAKCWGWQQFVYTFGNPSHNPAYSSVFMQYWLIGWGQGRPCPKDWISNAADCYRNGAIASPVPKQPVSSLATLKMKGSAVDGGDDQLIFIAGPNIFTHTNPDNMLGLAKQWHAATYNIFGDGNGSTAVFNAGSTIVVRVDLDNGTNNAPGCPTAGTSGESNSLNLLLTCCPRGNPSPSIAYKESNVASATASCGAGGSVGDTHLATVYGTRYDFQASGEFVLAQPSADFIVQTRQASGKPNWPNASINTAVATRMGTSTVAVCLDPLRVEIDGKERVMIDRQTISLPGGVQATRTGDVYVVRRTTGESVRAQVKGTYIDVSLGLGHQSAADVRGLLGNPNGDAEQLGMRDGTVLRTPIAFKDLYERFGDSWRVSTKESFLCKTTKPESGNPDRPFFARDLDPTTHARATAVCKRSGVRSAVLLDDCILDVAVLGGTAAKTYVSGISLPNFPTLPGRPILNIGH